MKHVIIGTAGHVDHGKTTLIHALTGTNTDRLIEEQERGMTIDIGFAALRLPDGTVAGIVDVPGHERFLKNMLAGATGVDVVLLVVAADESVMPQTLEHLDILKLLDVRNGVVALTKCDLAEPEWIAAVEQDVRGHLAGSFLADSPIIRISSTTRKGIEALKRALLSSSSRAQSRNASLPFRLPVDRVFTRAGFGTVVTGTLVAGTMRVGDAVEIVPQRITTRIRGLQIHSEKVDIAEAGSRVAVNIAGVEIESLERGAQLAPPNAVTPTQYFDAVLTLLPELAKPLSDRDRVRVHLGTAELIGRIRILDERDEITGGERAFIQFRSETSLAAARSDRFVVRTYSPMHTIGGGIVLDTAPPHHRKGNSASLARLTARERGTPEDLIETLLLQSREGVVQRAVRSETGVTPAEAQEAVTLLLSTGIAVATPNGRLFHQTALASLTDRALQTLSAYHGHFPLRVGMPREELRAAVGRSLDPKAFVSLLALWQERDLILLENSSARLAEFQVSMTERQQSLLARIEDVYRIHDIAIPPIEDVCREVRAPRDAVAALLAVGVERGRFVRVEDGLYYQAGTIARLKAVIVEYLKTHDSITVGAFRDLTETNRRFALLALEYLDTVRFTRRVGDDRVLVES